jgi:hypothetical protein
MSCTVPTFGMVMPMPMHLGMVIVPLQLAAGAMPHRLAMGHAATLADRPARWMSGSVKNGLAMMVRTDRVMVRPGPGMITHVDPAMGRARFRHRREGRWRR